MADIQPMIYCGAFAKGDTTVREFLINQYKNTDLSARNNGLLLTSLACGLDKASNQA
jgi:hypothetical protein